MPMTGGPCHWNLVGEFSYLVRHFEAERIVQVQLMEEEKKYTDERKKN